MKTYIYKSKMRISAILLLVFTQLSTAQNFTDVTGTPFTGVAQSRHTWPDENTNAQGVNRDINGCVEIWKFFSRFDINGSIASPLSINSKYDFSNTSVYPNPAEEFITIEIKDSRNDLRISNYLGQEFHLPTRLFDEKIQIDVRGIPSGIYVISSVHNGGMFQSTFIKK